MHRAYLHNYGTQQSFATDFPLLVARNWHGAPVVKELCARWVPKQLTPEHSCSNPRRQTSTTQYTEVGPTVWQMSQFPWRICWKKLNTSCICCNKYLHAIVFCFCTRPRGNVLCGWASFINSVLSNPILPNEGLLVMLRFSYWIGTARNKFRRTCFESRQQQPWCGIRREFKRNLTSYRNF
jgi:hypothetical protein